ncbi:MAG: peptidyl-prolyl cis-trans isomerase [Acetobacteraceae bacterium]
MITRLRRYLDTWVVRGLFIIMIAAFVFWGVGDIVRVVGTSTWVAQVGNQTIEGQALQAEYQRALSLATRDLPSGQEASPQLRQRVGQETLQRMVTQVAIGQELRDLRIVVPDVALADYARSMPAFRGPEGSFSKAVFDAVLRNNGLTEAQFLDMLRGELAQRQLLGAVSAGATAPDPLVAPLYAAEFEKRAADTATFPFAAAPEPSAPEETALQRWYDNHPDLYMTPEYRRIKAIVLSPLTLAKEINVTDAELQAAFEQNHARYVTPARRSAQVISAPDEAKANALAEKWRSTEDWAAMQATAQADGASAVAIDDATEAQFPDTELSKAVFAASPGAVSDPVKGGLGWYVVKVTQAVAGHDPTLDDVREQVRERVIAEKAADLMYDRANKVDNLLGNGTSLDQMPGDLGLAGLTGTLDAQGNTPEGNPAPIPGGPELKTALVAAAFQTQPGDPPRLIEVATPATGGSAYYALTVEDVIPAARKPFDTVREQVAEDWKNEQQRKSQEEAAARMLAAVKGGQSFSDAATVAGVVPRLTVPTTRSQPAEDMAPEVHRALFTLKKGEPTMVETADAFVVLELAEVIEPDPKADATGYEQAKTAISRSISGDIASIFAEAVRQRANPQVNQKNYDQIVQP